MSPFLTQFEKNFSPAYSGKFAGWKTRPSSHQVLAEGSKIGAGTGFANIRSNREGSVDIAFNRDYDHSKERIRLIEAIYIMGQDWERGARALRVNTSGAHEHREAKKSAYWFDLASVLDAARGLGRRGEVKAYLSMLDAEGKLYFVNTDGNYVFIRGESGQQKAGPESFLGFVE